MSWGSGLHVLLHPELATTALKVQMTVMYDEKRLAEQLCRCVDRKAVPKL